MEAKTRVAIQTLGCKVNQAETEALCHELAANGCEIVSLDGAPHICVVNTCTVTGTADQKSRQAVRRVLSTNPGAVVVATGCYARRTPAEVQSSTGAAIVTGERDPRKLASELLRATPSTRPAADSAANPAGARARSIIKVQDGCNAGCTYCIVPRSRGKETSVPAKDVLEQIIDRVRRGYREVVLTGPNVGRYRDGDTDLASLASLVLRSTALERLRLSSLQPRDINAGLLALFKDARMCRHFHLPLQSGSDAVLQAMGRLYRLEEFADAARRIRQEVKDVSITTDVIAGFPSETEVDHKATLQFCHDTGFAAIHVFPYSRRAGTPAAASPQVEEPAKRRRAAELSRLSSESARLFKQRFVGRSMPVLWEAVRLRGTDRDWEGLTDNYLVVKTADARDLGNLVIMTRLTGLRGDCLSGSVEP